MKKPLSWLALILFALLLWIIYLADTGSRLPLELVRLLPFQDKLAHLLLYGLMTFVLNLALELKTLNIGPLRVYFGTFAVTVFAVGEELSQAWLPHRTLDAQDLLADAIGILLFTLASAMVFRCQGKASGNRLSD